MMNNIDRHTTLKVIVVIVRYNFGYVVCVFTALSAVDGWMCFAIWMMDGWMDRWMGGWMEEAMDGRVKRHFYTMPNRLENQHCNEVKFTYGTG